MRADSIRSLAFEHLLDGRTKTETAKHVRVHCPTVPRWIKLGRGREREVRICFHWIKLTSEQEQELLAVLGKTPSLTLAHLAGYALRKFYVRISNRGISGIISRNGLIRKKGTKLNVRYQRDLGSRYLEDIRARYTPMIASLDEASFMLDLAPAYGWAPKGSGRSGRRTVSYSLFLCICPVGVLNWRLRSGIINSVIFPEFLGQLPDGITVMLDNAKIHHATKSLRGRDLSSVRELATS